MKRVYVRIITLILCFVLTFSAFGCTSCNENNEESNNNHQQIIEETGEWLVKAAKSEYKIVIPETADGNVVTASRELQLLFAEATGVTLDIVYDTNLKYSETAKYLSIDNNKLTRAVNLTADKAAIKSQGFYIKTIGNSIFMLGATTLGSLYAVYQYLNLEFNFEHYFTDLYHIDKNVTDKNLNKYDVMEIPDIDIMTVPSVGHIMYNTVNANRMRVVPIANWSIPQNNYNNVHNIFYIIPPDTFLKDHPSWYTTSDPNGIKDAQACFSAHTDLLDPNSDKTEYEALVNEFLNVIKKGVMKTDAEIFPISQKDNKGFCNCASCNKISNHYGAKSALLILLCNRLSDEMDEWFKTDEGKPYARDLKIMFLAYQDVEAAPAKYNPETEQYEANYPEIKCRDNVGVYIASLGVYNPYDFEHEVNLKIKENILSWRALTNRFMFWTYDVNFQNYFVPYESWNIRQEFYSLLAESGTMVLNDQGQTQNVGSCTAWDNLKSYLATKLRWNNDADLQALTKRYFEVCYKSASDTMYNLYLQYIAHSNEIKVKFDRGDYEGKINQGAIGDIFGGLQNAILWEKPMLTSWYNQYLKALEQLETIRESDPVGYEKAYQMVSAELVSPLYMLIKLYGATYSNETLEVMKRDFKKYCSAAKINYYKDSSAEGGIEFLYKELNIE